MSFRAGLVGYGLGGRVFHAPLLEAAGIDLAVVASRKANQIARDFPGAKAVNDPQTLFAEPDLDLVIISSPSHTHGTLAIEALEAGHNVVVDKPFAGSVVEADAIIAAAVRAEKMVTCFQNRRWDSDFRTIGDLMARDALGPIHDYRAHFEFYAPTAKDIGSQPPRPVDGIHFGLGTHMIDQAVQLFGTPDWVIGDLLSQRPGGQVVDHMHARLGYGTMRVTLTAALYSADISPRFMVHGAKGSYRKEHMDGQEAQLMSGMYAHEAGFGVENPSAYGTVTTHAQGSMREERWPSLNGEHHTFYRLVREAIQTATPPPVHAEEARDVIGIIEALERSSQTGQRVSV